MDFEKIKEEASRYALTIKLLNLILNDMKEAIFANSNLIMKANKEDAKINKRQIKVVEIINIIDSYRKSECVLNDDERKIVFYKGDPYLTIHLCLQAITQRTKILLVDQGFLSSVNEILFKIVDNILKEYKIFNLIDKVNYSVFELEKVENDFDELVVIGDSVLYQTLQTKHKTKFYPYNNIGVYCDTEELLKLQEAIYIYAHESKYEIEIYYEDNLDQVIDLINSDEFKDVAVLLTKSNRNKEKFERKIKNRKVFVNENPFKQEVEETINYLK